MDQLCLHTAAQDLRQHTYGQSRKRRHSHIPLSKARKPAQASPYPTMSPCRPKTPPTQELPIPPHMQLGLKIPGSDSYYKHAIKKDPLLTLPPLLLPPLDSFKSLPYQTLAPQYRTVRNATFQGELRERLSRRKRGRMTSGGNWM